jgi:hypothetical protein
MRGEAFFGLDFFGSFCACLHGAVSAKAGLRQKEQRKKAGSAWFTDEVSK